MINDPSEALQRSVYATLIADAAVSGMISKRVYDEVPPNAIFPCTSFGDFQVIPESGDCLQGAQVFMTLHTWSRPEEKVGSTENKKLGRAIVAALDDADLTTPDVRVNSCLLETLNYLADPDGKTSHGVLVFSILTD